MIRRPHLAVGVIGFGHRTLTEALLSTATAGKALHDDRPPVDPMTAFKAYEYVPPEVPFSRSIWATSGTDDWICDQDPEESELRRRQRQLREFVATTRKPEPVFLPPRWCKLEKPVARRWGGRAREQRDRRQS